MGAGAGYTLKGTDLQCLESNTFYDDIEPKFVTEVDGESYVEYTLTSKNNINFTVDKLECYSYNYGDTLEDVSLTTKAIKVRLYENEFKYMLTEVANKSIFDLIKESITEIESFETMIGRGWVHVTFEGTFTIKVDLRLSGCNVDTTVEIELSVDNDELTKYIDKAVTGDNLGEIFIVNHGKDDMKDFVTEKEAIDYCKENGIEFYRRAHVEYRIDTTDVEVEDGIIEVK